MPLKKSKTKKKRPSTSAAKPRRARKSPPGRAGPVNDWMELRRSSIHGLGAFARTDIPKGTRIIEYTGEKVSNAEAERRYDDEAMEEHHTFLFILSTRTCIDAAREGNEARFINHSCGPNCEARIRRGHIYIEALRRIPAGAELSYDYEYDDEPGYTDEDYRRYACQCGAPNCRGTIVDTKKFKP